MEVNLDLFLCHLFCCNFLPTRIFLHKVLEIKIASMKYIKHAFAKAIETKSTPVPPIIIECEHLSILNAEKIIPFLIVLLSNRENAHLSVEFIC